MCKRTLSLIAATSLVALIAAACGSGNAGYNGAATPPGPSPAATAPAVTPSPRATGTAPAGAVLTITARNLAFDKTTLQAPAGKVTVEFNNQDAGVMHDFHLFKGDSASGQSLGATSIKAGPGTESMTFDLTPGTYYYQCDVHPTTMNGTLTVS